MDALDEMTKEEIVSFLRRDFHYSFNPIRMSDVLFERWQIKSRELQDKRAKSLEALSEIDMSKRDEYARQFNATSDVKERMSLLEKMSPYEKAFRNWWANEQKIEIESKKVDALYDSIDIARKKEQTSLKSK